MKKQTIKNFFLGLLIAFTLSMVFLCIAMSLMKTYTLPVKLVYEAFGVSVLCSLINLVYCSEKLTFMWQSIIGYLINTMALLTCSLVFKWISPNYILGAFLLFSAAYLITWLIIWRANKNKEKELNNKLNEYKNKQ